VFYHATYHATFFSIGDYAQRALRTTFVNKLAVRQASYARAMNGRLDPGVLLFSHLSPASEVCNPAHRFWELVSYRGLSTGRLERSFSLPLRLKTRTNDHASVMPQLGATFAVNHGLSSASHDNIAPSIE
jgi:hypothetical protein